jgi:hypothetical protein
LLVTLTPANFTHTHTTDHPWPARGSSSAWYENANCFLLESLTHQSLAHSVFCDRVGTQRRSRHRGRQGGRIRAGEERTLFRLATTPAFRSWAVRPLEAHRRTGLYELSFPFCFFLILYDGTLCVMLKDLTYPHSFTSNLLQSSISISHIQTNYYIFYIFQQCGSNETTTNEIKY